MSILDEIDSGLDIDALREVATAVNGLRNKDSATLMVTHYQANFTLSHHLFSLDPVHPLVRVGMTSLLHHGNCLNDNRLICIASSDL